MLWALADRIPDLGFFSSRKAKIEGREMWEWDEWLKEETAHSGHPLFNSLAVNLVEMYCVKSETKKKEMKNPSKVHGVWNVILHGVES